MLHNTSGDMRHCIWRFGAIRREYVLHLPNAHYSSIGGRSGMHFPVQFSPKMGWRPSIQTSGSASLAGNRVSGSKPSATSKHALTDSFKDRQNSTAFSFVVACDAVSERPLFDSRPSLFISQQGSQSIEPVRHLCIRRQQEKAQDST